MPAANHGEVDAQTMLPSVVRPTIANLISNVEQRPSLAIRRSTTPDRLLAHVALPIRETGLSIDQGQALTHPNPTDPTVRTLGLFPPSALPPADPTAITPDVPSPAKKQKITSTPGDPPQFGPPEPFKLTYAHVLAYRKFQLRQPTGSKRRPIIAGAQRTPNSEVGGTAAGDEAHGEKRKGRRTLCIAEAVWELWAERGGLGKAGKEIRAKKAQAKARAAGVKAKGKGKARARVDEAGEVVDEEDEDGNEDEEEDVRACMAYSYDENGDPYKPAISHVQIIRLVLASDIDKIMTLSQIYQAIEARWPYFRTDKSNWKGSIRHNLSHHDCFQAVTRVDKAGHPIKGSWWKVDEEIAGPLYPRSKDSPSKPSSKPLLTSAVPPHPLHPSFTFLDPLTTPTGGRPPTNIQTTTGPNGESLRFKMSKVDVPGKAMEFPLPGVWPHQGGQVPAGYPTPVPAGWTGGWGDVTLMDIGRRYGSKVHASEELEMGGEADTGATGPADPEGKAHAGVGGRSGLPRQTTPSGIINLLGGGPAPSSFAPLSDFSAFLAAPPPQRCFSPMSSASSSTSSSLSISSSAPDLPALHPRPTPPPYLPFLDLLAPLQTLESDIGALPPSNHPLLCVTPGESANETPFAPATHHLQAHGAGFVPPEIAHGWRARSKFMRPFPAGGEWMRPISDVPVALQVPLCHDFDEGVRGSLPGIEAVFGKVERGDPRDRIKLGPPGKARRAMAIDKPQAT